jgi:hypothetical protein
VLLLAPSPKESSRPLAACLRRAVLCAGKYVVEIEQETDGRWIAEIPRIPGAMAYGSSRPETVPHARTVGYGATLWNAGAMLVRIIPWRPHRVR